MFDWDDLKYFLAVAQHGSALAAGRALKVDQSTVQRRLAELERRIGQQLVQRSPTGYRLTEFGVTMLPHAQRIAQDVRGLEHHLESTGRDAVGLIRVTCPEPLVLKIAQTSLLERFHTRHPGLRVQFVVSDKFLDLAKGEADVALRSGDTDDPNLVGRKVGDSFWAVYASRKYIELHGQPETVAALAQHALVGFDETMTHHRAAKWLLQVAPSATFVARNSSVLGLISTVKAGMGLAPLPAPLGDVEPDLVRVLGPIPELTRSWRLLTRADLRLTPRVSAFFDFIVEEIETLRPILTG